MARRKVQQPTVTPETSPIGGTVVTHPAYAVIRASRTQGTAHLFGSDFTHHATMRIEVAPATLRRTLSQDWVHGHVSPLVEVELSEAQWAAFISTPNSGTGTPCTLRWHAPGGQGEVPGVPPPEPRITQAQQEMGEALQAIHARLVTLEATIRSAILPKRMQETLAKETGLIAQALRANVPFMVKQYASHLETTTEQARVEVEAYITGAIQRAGLKALAAAQGETVMELPVMLPERTGQERVDTHEEEQIS